MSAFYDYQVPYPVDQVWGALPYAVHYTKHASGGNPMPDSYRFVFSTGMTLLTFGFQMFVDLYPQYEAGTHMRVTANMHFGLVDWGEGRRVADNVYSNLMYALNYGGDPGYGGY